MNVVLPTLTAVLCGVGLGLAIRGFLLFKSTLMVRLNAAREPWWTSPRDARDRRGMDALVRSDRYTAAGFACMGAGFFTLILSFLAPA